MPSVETLPIVVATLAFLLAGFVKGVIGLGLPTVSMGLLTLVMAPAKAASLLIVPSFVTNVWQLAAGPSFWPPGAAAVANAGRHCPRHARGNGIADREPCGASGCRARASADALRPAGSHLGALLRSPGSRAVAGASDRGADRPRHSRDRRVRYPRRAVSRGAQSGQGGHDPGAWPLLHGLHHCARGRACGRRALLRLAMSAFRPPRLRRRSSAWRPAAPCAAASASEHFGARSSADCSCSALTSPRGR